MKVAAVTLVVAAAAVALALAAPWRHAAARDGEVSVTRSTLLPGRIDLMLENGSDAAARVAQVIVNDAYVDFHASRLALAPGQSETIILSYPWIDGEAYEIELLTSTGRSVDYEVEEAA